MNNYDIALSWLDKGVGVIPCHYRSKRPVFSWDHLKTELPTEKQIKEWFSGKLTNIGVIMGFNNLGVIDFDNLDAYQLWLNTYGRLGYADTYTVKTGRGFHLYFYVQDYPPHTMKWKGGECKFSGYVLAPNSIHPAGRTYKATNPEVPILDIASIYEILPEDVFNYQQESGPCMPLPDSIWSPVIQGNYSEINQQVRILSFFPDARRTGNGWYTVKCVLHDDKNASAWIDDNRNRYGCHACHNGSLSVIDFYSRLRNIAVSDAVNELQCMI